ncbi:MAG: flagellar filament capping protein FliD [Pseudobutyrivibrio sp.]|nr:flagellar filament capping protein FliD [Pseudobutyrivibrio sp.]
MSLTINSNNFNTISSLLGSMTTGNRNSSTGIESMLSDYYSIKSGSYGKLINSYVKEYGADALKDKTNKVDATEDTKELNVIRNDSKDLTDSISKLMNTGKDSIWNKVEIEAEDGTKTLEYDTDKIYNAVSDFVNKYNDLIDSGQKANNTSILTQLAGMVTTTSASSKTLASVGITVDANNHLSVDEKFFKDTANMTSVEGLFNGNVSYINRINTKAQMVNSLSSTVLSNITGTKGYTNGGNYNLSMTDVINGFNTTT